MSIEAMNWALKQRTGSPASKSVLLILANRADNRGICWPGLNGIAEQTELSKRAVINNIRKLEDGGFLTTETRQQPKTNLYRLNLLSSEPSALVNEVHGESSSPEVVNVVHLSSERGAPEPSVTISKPKKENPDVEGLNLEAWKLWVDYRRKAKLRKYTTDMKAKELAKLSHAEQMQCVKYSISNEYQGLFPDRKNAPGRKLTYAEQLAEDMKHVAIE